MLLPCSSGQGTAAAVTATLAPAACTARPSLPARRSSSCRQAVTAAAAHKQQACIAPVPAAGVQQRTASCSIPALQDVQRAAALHSRHRTAACRAFSSGISMHSRSRHRRKQQLAVRCQALDPGVEPLGSSSSGSTGNGGSGNGFSNGSSSSSSASGSSLDASTPPDASPAAALATMEGAAAMAAATVVQTAAETSSPFASVSTADTDAETDAGAAVGDTDADAAAAAAAVSAESPDVLCQVDELDTPEALTDVQYSAPSPSSRRFSSAYTPGTWQGEDEDEPQDAAFAWWKNRDDLITLAYAVAMGGVVATSVFCFDVAIQYVHDLPDIFSQVCIVCTQGGLGVGDTTCVKRQERTKLPHRTDGGRHLQACVFLLVGESEEQGDEEASRGKGSKPLCIWARGGGCDYLGCDSAGMQLPT